MVLPRAALLALLPAVCAQLQPFANNTGENLDFAESPPKYPSPVSELTGHGLQLCLKW